MLKRTQIENARLQTGSLNCGYRKKAPGHETFQNPVIKNVSVNFASNFSNIKSFLYV